MPFAYYDRLSPARKRIYLSRSTRAADSKQGVPPLTILSFSEVDGKWSLAENLPLPSIPYSQRGNECM